MKQDKKIEKSIKIRWQLVGYDLIVFLFSCWFIFVFYQGKDEVKSVAFVSLIAGLFSFASRFLFKVYTQVWRYGGIQSYVKLLVADAVAFPFVYVCQRVFVEHNFDFPRCLSACCINVLLALGMRMIYRYAYKFGNIDKPRAKVLRALLKLFTFNSLTPIAVPDNSKIKVAIIGAGSVGITLADELIHSPVASYYPICFIDTDKEKVGRDIHNLPVLSESDSTLADLESYGIQEVIFTIPSSETERRKNLYEYYKNAGYKIKVYDYPTVQNAGSNKRHLREFDPEELLFRKPLDVVNDKTLFYYRDKVILITGGGGSIGSELCRQIAKMSPKQLIILDVYENGAYDIQQELKITYGSYLDVRVEIVSVCNLNGLDRVFNEYHPHIVLNAAAHKHVPLMEKNCIEAVENNVFGTLNTVLTSIKYNVERVIMVSTDKAVNPTNVMGATKRMCEMIVQAYSASGCSTTFSTTRFGNVLGSAGSVIPLFKKQIAHGGPVSVTDKRIIRYFMTIPEASQLVLASGAMAQNGELFVLDMGKPVKILDLAENMIRLSGMEPGVDIEIIETGLRPGEKLYEELLVKTEKLGKTENELIFTEQDTPVSLEVVDQKLKALRIACESGNDDEVKKVLKNCIPTFRSPEDVNASAEKTVEMRMANK